MDFVKAFRSAEDFVFLVGSWLILIPKTLGRVFVSAEWTHFYVTAQLAKPKIEERYTAYVSPILFWVAVAIVPYIAVFNHYFALSAAAPDQTFAALPLETKLLILSLCLIGLPMGFSFVYNLFRNPIDRDSLQPMFLTQCYCVALFELSLLPYLVHKLAVDFDQRIPFAARHRGLIAIIGSIWFLQTEYRVVRSTLETDSVKTAFLTLIFVSLSMGLTIGMVVLMGLVLIEAYG
jgi:hypothetical protein